MAGNEIMVNKRTFDWYMRALNDRIWQVDVQVLYTHLQGDSKLHEQCDRSWEVAEFLILNFSIRRWDVR